MDALTYTMLGIDRILNGSSHSSGDRQHGRKSAMRGDQERPEECSPCDDAGTAGVVYPPACEERYYDAASKILEDEGPLAGNCHDNANELGALIQQWIEDARDNWEPR